MFCKQCGKEIEEGRFYCEECEAELAEQEELEVVEVLEVEEEPVKKEEKDRTKGFATAAMILGFCGLFLPFFNIITSILAIVFGILGRKHDLGVVGLVSGIIFFVNRIYIGILSTAYIIMYIAIFLIGMIGSMQ